MLHRDGVLRPDVDIALAGPDGIARDGHGLDDTVGVALQHAPVHEGPGVALVRVAADIFLYLAPFPAGKAPLQSGGEACSAPAPQAGVQHDLDHLVRRQFGQALLQCRIAVPGNVLVNVLGVDDAAVAQGNAQLLLVELCLLQAADCAGGLVLVVEQAVHPAALEQMLTDDLRHVLHMDMAVDRALREHCHVGPAGAQPQTAAPHHLDLFTQTGQLQLDLEFLRQLLLPARQQGAVGPPAYHHIAAIHSLHLPLLTAPMVYSASGLPPRMCCCTTRTPCSGVMCT